MLKFLRFDLHLFKSKLCFCWRYDRGWSLKCYDKKVYEQWCYANYTLLNQSFYSCGMPREYALHIFRSPKTGGIPWTIALTGLSFLEFYVWCMDQVFTSLIYNIKVRYLKWIGMHLLFVKYRRTIFIDKLKLSL